MKTSSRLRATIGARVRFHGETDEFCQRFPTELDHLFGKTGTIVDSTVLPNAEQDDYVYAWLVRVDGDGTVVATRSEFEVEAAAPEKFTDACPTADTLQDAADARDYRGQV